MPRTTNKGIRFTDTDLAHIDMLYAQLPDYLSEADLLRHAALLGIMVLATNATRPGLTPYAGYAPNDLAALLKPRLMPAIDFLIASDAMPAVFQGQRGSERVTAAPSTLREEHSAIPPRAPQEEHRAAIRIDHTAGTHLEGFGTGMMDD